MRTGKYTRQQIKLLRDELNAVYKRAQREQADISWKEIAGWIEDAFEKLSSKERNSIAEPYRKIKSINLGGTDSFRKFCIGQTNRMEPIKLIAIDIWLTEKDDEEWSQLTTEKLKGLKDYSRVASSLESYLFENNLDSPALNAEGLIGDYDGTYCVESSGERATSEFLLKINKSLNPHILVVEVDESRVFEGSVLSDFEEETQTETHQYFSGWVVLSPEDNLICYLKNAKTGINSIYYLIAINESVFDGNQADCILFLDRQIPSEISDSKNPGNFCSYLTDWAKENQCSLIKFQRRID